MGTTTITWCVRRRTRCGLFGLVAPAAGLASHAHAHGGPPHPATACTARTRPNPSFPPFLTPSRPLVTPKRNRHPPTRPQMFYPVPRFPAGHTSAAFEAMAVRKSLILTPPEIYAECAHHGARALSRGPGFLGCGLGFGRVSSCVG